MKTLIFVFLPIAGIGAILKLLLIALKKDSAIKILETVLGFTLLLSVIPNTKTVIPKIENNSTADEAYFSKIQEEQLAEILHIAEKDLEPILKQEAEELTGTAPTACRVLLEKENFSIQEIDFFFSKNSFLSAYEIVLYFKEKYGAEVTVTME